MDKISIPKSYWIRRNKMKLYLKKPIDDNYNYLELDYWSFVKCFILSYFGIIGTIFFVGFCAGVIVTISEMLI